MLLVSFASSLLAERDTVSPDELLFGMKTPKSSTSERELVPGKLPGKLLDFPGVQMSLLSSFRPGVRVVDVFLKGDAPKILDTEEEIEDLDFCV